MLGKTEKNEDALIYLNKILEFKPGNNIALFLKGIIYEKLGMISEHYDNLEKASIIGHLDCKEDIQTTIQQFDKCFKTYIYELNGLNIRGLLLVELRQYCDEEEFFYYLEEHIKILEKAIEFHDKITENDLGYRYLWHNIDSFTKNNRNKDVKTLKYCSNELKILFSAATFEQLGIYNQIAVFHDFLLDHGVISTCILNNKGISLSRSLRDDEAIECFNKALEIDPKYVCALNNLGVITGLIEYFDKILEIDDQILTAWFNKSFSLFRTRKYDDIDQIKKAREYCERALTINPNDKDSLYLKACIHQFLGNYEKATEGYEKVLEIAPKNTYILRKQGELLFKMEKYIEAIKYLDKAINLKPGNMYLWENLVKIYKKVKDREKEFNCYEEMLKEWPGYTSALLGKGRMLVDKGKYEEAIRVLDQVEGGENWDNLWPYAIFHKARAVARQNNKSEVFRLVEETIRAGAALSKISGSYRKDLEIKELIKKSSDFEKYKNFIEFKSILAHDYNNKEEIDKFWNQFK